MGGTVEFLCASLPAALAARLAREGFTLTMLDVIPATLDDAAETRRLTGRADWLLVDGYDFRTEWLSIVRDTARLALWTDHDHADHLPVDLILNQNPHASADAYIQRAPKAYLLLGLDYTVLRSEFTAFASSRSPRVDLRRLLVTFGGGAAQGAHAAFLQGAKHLGDRLPQTTLIVGHAHPDPEDIVRQASSLRGVSVRLANDDFPALVTRSDLAISAAGATLWELAFLGVPSLAIILAQNQEPLASYLHSAGAGISLGWVSGQTPGAVSENLGKLITDSDLLAKMSRRALALVDGHGARRVCVKLLEHTC